MQAQARGSMPSVRLRSAERGHLVPACLHDVAHAELAHAHRHRGRAAAAQRRDRDSALHEELDAVSVAHVKHLELLASRREIQAPVGEYAVHVEHHEPDPAERHGASGLAAGAGRRVFKLHRRASSRGR